MFNKNNPDFFLLPAAKLVEKGILANAKQSGKQWVSCVTPDYKGRGTQYAWTTKYYFKAPLRQEDRERLTALLESCRKERPVDQLPTSGCSIIKTSNMRCCMGGFTLKGPTYKFSNCVSTHCRCPPFKVDIDEATEDKLLNKRVLRLYVSRDLFPELREQIKKERPHLGTDRTNIFERNDYDPVREAEQQVRKSANDVLRKLSKQLQLADAQKGDYISPF